MHMLYNTHAYFPDHMVWWMDEPNNRFGISLEDETAVYLVRRARQSKDDPIPKIPAWSNPQLEMLIDEAAKHKEDWVPYERGTFVIRPLITEECLQAIRNEYVCDWVHAEVLWYTHLVAIYRKKAMNNKQQEEQLQQQ